MPWVTILAAVLSLSGLAVLLRACSRLAATCRAAHIEALGQRQDRRKLWRMKVGYRGTLAAIRGVPRDMPARCADLSDYGALVLVRQPLEKGLEVAFSIPSLRLIGVGRVRHCRRRIFRYAVGIAFNGPLRRADVGNWTIRKQA